ncbi:ion transporter [Leptolyngbyaceae cyanobacterium UHCC 1019]
MNSLKLTEKQALEHERSELLQQLEDWLDIPMLVLSFIWLALFVLELTYGLNSFLEGLSITIWIMFIVEFGIKLLLAPRKVAYLKAQWLTAISLLLPAFRTVRIIRVFRVLQTTRAVRGLQLLRVLTRTNRSMRSLAANFTRRGFGYVVLLTAIVTLAGAAGMYAFEQAAPNAPGFDNYGTALWWTAMLMTTMGSEYSPQTAEGRILFFLLALYAFAMFGYVTATLATFFIGQDAEDEKAELAGAKSIEALRTEIMALRTEIHNLQQRDR